MKKLEKKLTEIEIEHIVSKLDISHYITTYIQKPIEDAKNKFQQCDWITDKRWFYDKHFNNYVIIFIDQIFELVLCPFLEQMRFNMDSFNERFNFDPKSLNTPILLEIFFKVVEKINAFFGFHDDKNNNFDLLCISVIQPFEPNYKEQQYEFENLKNISKFPLEKGLCKHLCLQGGLFIGLIISKKFIQQHNQILFDYIEKHNELLPDSNKLIHKYTRFQTKLQKMIKKHHIELIDENKGEKTNEV